MNMPNSGRRENPYDFEDSHASRQLKECSFVPEMNENSKKLAKHIPKLYERSKHSESNLTDRKDYQNKSLYLSAKYNKSQQSISYSTSHKRIGDPDIELFRNQLRNKEIDNIHVRNEVWLQNRENKIINDLKQKDDKQENSCTFVPKTNQKKSKKVHGTFLERREFDMQKRNINKRDLSQKSYNECTFKPKIDTKSLKMAEKRHEMLKKLDHITGHNNTELNEYDTEEIRLMNRHCKDHGEKKTNVKSYVRLKPDDLYESHSSYEDENSEVKYTKNYLQKTHSSRSKSQRKFIKIDETNSDNNKTVLQMHKNLLYRTQKPGTTTLTNPDYSSSQVQNVYLTQGNDNDRSVLEESIINVSRSVKKMKKETDKLKQNYSKNTISFDKNLKKKFKKDGSSNNIIHENILSYEMNEVSNEDEGNYRYNTTNSHNNITRTNKKYSSDRAISPVIAMDSNLRKLMPHNQPQTASKKNFFTNTETKKKNLPPVSTSKKQKVIIPQKRRQNSYSYIHSEQNLIRIPDDEKPSFVMADRSFSKNSHKSPANNIQEVDIMYSQNIYNSAFDQHHPILASDGSGKMTSPQFNTNFVTDYSQSNNPNDESIEFIRESRITRETQDPNFQITEFSNQKASKKSNYEMTPANVTEDIIRFCNNT